MTTAVKDASISRQEPEKLSREQISLKTGDRKEGREAEDAGNEKQGKVKSGQDEAIAIQARAANEFRRQTLARTQAEQRVRSEITTPTDREEFFKVGAPALPPEDLKEALAKLRQILQTLQLLEGLNTKNLKNLAAEIKSILDILSSYNEAMHTGEKIATPLARLVAAVRGSGIPVDKEIQGLLNEIESALDKISGVSAGAGKAQLGEDIGALFENIKMALKQLRSNIQSGRPPFEPPPEVKEMFANLSRLSGAVRDTLAAYADNLPSEVKQMMATLQSHFEPLDISQNALKLAPKLKSLVEDSGIFFEKKIHDAVGRLADASARIGGESPDRLPGTVDTINNDLKPNLLLLREYFDSDKFPSRLAHLESFAVIKRAVEDLLTNIDNQQGRAMDAEVLRQPVLVFSFQLPLKGGAEARLKVFYNRKRKKKEEGEFKLSLLLDMNRLGEIRTDFSQAGKKLNITFFVKNNKIKEYIETHLDEVEEPLGPGFKSVNLKVSVSREKIAAFAAEPVGPGIVTDKAVDIKV
ncbi:MAG: hypothetical protein NT166_25875 [Candidatus Aminicenantes bacterium]|nr:hypothetical protein [Candidatus Aminicenantes bacterium]